MAEVLITQRTLNYLTGRRKELEERLVKQGQDSDGGHQRAAVHDDQATELFKNELRSELARIGRLDNVAIIQPRQENSTVELGNRVGVSFLQLDDSLSALVLSGTDSVYSSHTNLGDIITPESPLGKAIIGRRVREEVEIKTKPPKRVRIDEILPGDF